MSIRDALIAERAGYLARGLTDRAAEVDVELARLGEELETADDAQHGVETADAPTRRRRK